MPMSLTARRWAELVSALEKSDLTARAFAAQHHVNPSTLSWWRSRLRGTLPSRGFVAVELAVAASPPPAPTRRELRLEFTDRPVALPVHADTDLMWLRAVVDALS